MTTNFRFLRTITIATALSLFSILLSIVTMSTILEQKKVVREVVEVKTVLVVTDKQRINLFIGQLLTPKSATCLRKLLNAESRFDANAKNPSSSARGVGQLLESTYTNIGLKHSSDGLAQVVASLAYISRRYGSAGTCGAWKHEQQHNWY